jgi:hypothetical protein
MRRISTVIAIITAVMLVLLSFGCGQPSPAPASTTAPTVKPSPAPSQSPTPAPAPVPAPTPQLPSKFIFAGSGAGKAAALAAYMSEMATKYTPMKGSVEKVTGSPEAIKGVADGTFQSAVYSAASTTGVPDDLKKQLRVLFCGAGPETSTIIAIQTIPKTGIKTVKDLKDKRVYAENPALVFFGPIFETILKANGMTKDSVKWLIFNNADNAYRDLKEGRVDAMFYTTGTGTTTLAQEAGFFAVPLDEATTKAVEATGYGYYGYIWPKGMFGNSVDTLTLASPNLVWSSTKLSDDAAYTYVKAIFEHLKELQDSQPAAAGFTKENALIQWTFPYHPGAIKYFKEIKLWTADMDKKQADLIAKWSK